MKFKFIPCYIIILANAIVYNNTDGKRHTNKYYTSLILSLSVSFLNESRQTKAIIAPNILLSVQFDVIDFL